VQKTSPQHGVLQKRPSVYKTSAPILQYTVTMQAHAEAMASEVWQAWQQLELQDSQGATVIVAAIQDRI
jgi:hypothetical protein